MRRHVFLPMLPGQPYGCFPESTGWYDDDPGHDVDRPAGALPCFNLHLVTAGRGFLETEGRTVALHKGDGFLFFPGQRQRYYSSTDDPWDIRWIHFHAQPLQPFLMEKGLHLTSVWSLRQWKPLEKAFHRLLLEMEERQFLRPTRVSALTYELLTVFMTQAVPRDGSRTSGRLEAVVRLLPQLQKLANRPFELDYWAAQAGVSPYYFCRLFRRATLMTPSAFVTLCRLQLAKRLLLQNGDWPVKRIAAEAGYPGQSYFNKQFLAHEGVTPTEYRRLHWEKTTEA